MSDASCSGPSPFKRLVQHQSRDVSHHQDRLVDRSALNPQASFRSGPHHALHAQQDSFGAFLNSPASVSGPHDPADRVAAYAAALQQRDAIAAPAAPSSWAADFDQFANLRISNPMHPSPLPQQQQQQAQPWAPSQAHMAARFQTAFAPRQPYMPFATCPVPNQPDLDAEMSRWVTSHGAPRDMSDVDAAIDRIAEQLQRDEATAAVDGTRLSDLDNPEIQNLSEAKPSSSLENQTRPPEPSQADRFTPFSDASVLPLEVEPQSDGDTDALQRQQSQENVVNPSKSAVSEAAERLLDSVRHEDGDKWQNSTFLSLMRDFRDGRKDIVDNEVRQTVADSKQGPE